MKNKAASRTFRPWPDNQARLEIAAKTGVNVSNLLNELLNEHFNEYMQRRLQLIEGALKGLPDK